MNLLLLGATGLVGKEVLAQALANPAITRVIAPTRRPLLSHSRLINPVSGRLELLIPEAMQRDIDAVICTLGTTMKQAGSREAFREADYELPLKLALAAHQNSVDTFVLVSASTASANSRVFYSRTKGELERDIRLIGFPSLTIVRPSLIGGQREESRPAEHIALRLMKLLAPVLPMKLHINPAGNIADACLQAAITIVPGVTIRGPESLIALR